VFDLLGGGLLGSVFGGIFRLVPEVLRMLDKANERKHELSMFQLQTDLEKMRGEYRMEEKYVDYSSRAVDAISEAFREQSATAQAAGKWVAAFSASVRPGITWSLFGLYAAVKGCAIALAFDANADWRDVLVANWSSDDFGMLTMVLTFWFVGRSIEKYK